MFTYFNNIYSIACHYRCK